MNKNNIELKKEKMIIDIPKNTFAVSVVTLSEQNGEYVMNNHIYDTTDIEERKVESEE